jgi:hypothetical protein
VSTASGQSPDATGKWDLSVTTQQGTNTAVMELKKTGEKLSGTVTGPQGTISVEGVQKDKAVELYMNLTTANGPMSLTMTGTQTGDSMSGMMDFAGRGQVEWTAKRSAAAPATAAAATPQDKVPQDKEKPLDVSGAWQLDVQTQAGSGTPTVTFKQDGEKLTGRYVSQIFGELDVTGTLKGNAITFGFTTSVEGNSIKVAYSGTVEKDTMKGTVSFGDAGDGTFTGKKK